MGDGGGEGGGACRSRARFVAVGADRVPLRRERVWAMARDGQHVEDDCDPGGGPSRAYGLGMPVMRRPAAGTL